MRAWRALLLRIMLSALGVAAVVGAMAFLFAAGDWPGRITAMAFATAVAAGMLIGALALMDRPKLFWAGVVLGAATLIEYLGAMYLIGPADFLRQTYGLRDWAIEGTMLSVGGVFIPFMIGVQVIFQTRFRWTGLVTLSVSTIALLIWLAGAWGTALSFGSNRWWWDERMWTSGGIILGMGMVAALAMIDFLPDSRRHWRWLGILGATMTAAAVIWDTWKPTGGPEWPVITSTTVALVTAFVMVVLAAKLPVAQRWLAHATVAAGIACGSVLVASVLLHEFGPQSLSETREFMERASGAAGILAGCGLLAVWIVARVVKPPRYETEPVFIKEITLVCPRCQKKQTLPLGESQCGQCLLHLAVKVAEPHCEKCGYILYNVPGSACPECGHPTSAAVVTV